VLTVLAQLLRERTRASDVMVRYGGEEFLLVLPGMSEELARDMCERLREHVATQPWSDIGVAQGVSVSIGLVSGREGDLPALLKRADEALYLAKHQGRNRVCVAQP